MIIAALFAAALGGAPVNPCDAVTRGEVERILGGAPVALTADELGEETPPSCHWADASRRNRIDLSIWSAQELPVVGMIDAAAYFAKLKAEDGGAGELYGVGDSAFDSWRLTASGQAEGSVVVLKGDRLFVFAFLGSLLVVDAHAFVARVIARS